MVQGARSVWDKLRELPSWWPIVAAVGAFLFTAADANMRLSQVQADVAKIDSQGTTYGHRIGEVRIAELAAIKANQEAERHQLDRIEQEIEDLQRGTRR